MSKRTLRRCGLTSWRLPRPFDSKVGRGVRSPAPPTLEGAPDVAYWTGPRIRLTRCAHGDRFDSDALRLLSVARQQDTGRPQP